MFDELKDIVWSVVLVMDDDSIRYRKNLLPYVIPRLLDVSSTCKLIHGKIRWHEFYESFLLAVRRESQTGNLIAS